MGKILHRIFFNFDDGEDPFLPFLESWKRELPDFTIMEWNKDNLPLDLNPFTVKMAREKNHAFLSDYFRCWLLKQYGGVYLDADIEILKGSVFRNLFEEAEKSDEYDLFIGIESRFNGFLTAHSMGLGGSDSHEILDFMMDLYEKSFSGPLSHIIKKFPMPQLMSLFFIEKETSGIPTKAKKGRFRGIQEPVIDNGIKIYPQDYFSPVTTRSAYRGPDKIISSYSVNTCLCHHFAATWGNDTRGRALINTFSQNIESKQYTVNPDILFFLKLDYPNCAGKLPKPKWKLKSHSLRLRIIELVLNILIPYNSKMYKRIKKSKAEYCDK